MATGCGGSGCRWRGWGRGFHRHRRAAARRYGDRHSDNDG